MSGARRLLVLLLVATCGCAGMTKYHRGSPKRIDTQVRTGPAVISIDVERTTTGQLFAVVFEHVGVEVEQVLVYGTVESVGEYQWWGEFVEVPTGVFFALFVPLILAFAGGGHIPDTESEINRQPWNQMVMVFGSINPAQSFLFPKVVRNYDCEEELFKTAPVTTALSQGRPIEGATVAYEWKDAAGAVIASGSGLTDPFGRAAVEPPAGDAAAAHLELRVGDGPVVPIDPAALPSAVPPGS